MKDERITENSVVQINEKSPDVMWQGCFVQVDEVKTWGVQGWVNIPQTKGEPSGNAYIRLNWDQIDYIGQAVMVPAPKSEEP